MSRLKPLKPTNREQKRYISFQIIAAGRLPFMPVKNAITQTYKDLFGAIGSSEANIKVLKERWDEDKQEGIIQVNHKYLDRIRASFTLIKSIGQEPVICSSKRASGTIKKAGG